MDSPLSHPRRRLLNNNCRPTAPSIQPTPVPHVPTPYMLGHPLRKSATFHSPTSPRSPELDPILNIPSLPRRSPTCPKDLEDTLAAGGDRIAQIIGAVDRSLSGLESFSSASQDTLVAEDHPVPLFMINTHVTPSNHMAVVEASALSGPRSHHHITNEKHHASDSGIGSTVSSSELSVIEDHADMKQATTHTRMAGQPPSPLHEGRIQSGINGSTVPAAGPMTVGQHVLSEFACRQIQKHIIAPIIREERLKNFHPLVRGIPHRVARKEITCLRDLEKVLLWLAPKWSVSKALFLNFCETSIQCIHTTVDYLNDNDQRRPADRPYTNGYFLDLVEQVRQYAQMLTPSRAVVTSEHTTVEGKSASEERLELVGGLARTGRPAELVRTENGRSVSLRTGEDMSSEALSAYQHGLKRSMSEESDEDILRSMARRRKSAQPVVKGVQKCSECEKIFKRPCDLTKHEKTHSRPWKCSEIDCKYHGYGWPTEKERDRHVNDKHSATPSMYRCHFHPCPYESKRESNCKQHMEKAHGWEYVRSKNNGKTARKPPTSKTPSTPQMSTPGSYIFDAPTPELQESPAYYGFTTAHRHPTSLTGSIAASDLSASAPNDNLMDFTNTFGPSDPNLTWNENTPFESGSYTEYTASSHRPSWDSSAVELPATLPSSFETSLTPNNDDQIFGANFDWSNMDLTSLNIQLITPATSTGSRPFDAFNGNSSTHGKELYMGQVTSLSPGACGDAMLYSPHSMQSDEAPTDEGYSDFADDGFKPTHDFSLFSNSNTTSSLHSTENDGMFQDLSAMHVPSTWSGRGTDLANQLGMEDLMQIDD